MYSNFIIGLIANYSHCDFNKFPTLCYIDQCRTLQDKSTFPINLSNVRFYNEVLHRGICATSLTTLWVSCQKQYDNIIIALLMSNDNDENHFTELFQFSHYMSASLLQAENFGAQQIQGFQLI